MGAADVVPGVSGGVQLRCLWDLSELINSINKINLKALQILKDKGIKEAWEYVDETSSPHCF